jgi:hypothetical protein
MREEQYWKQASGEVISVGDMSEDYTKSVLRTMIKKCRQRGQDVLVMRDKISEINNTLNDIKRDLL